MSLSVDQSLSKAKRHAKRGETDRAAAIYQRVLEKYPKNQKAIAGLKALGPSQEQMNGLIRLYSHGQFAETLMQAEALVKQFPNAPFLPNLLGAVNAGLGRLEHAAASYAEALRLQPSYAEARNNLADTLNGLGRPKEAISHLAKALQVEPNFAEAHNNMGNALYLVGKLDEAEASYERALKIMPAYAEAHRNLSTVKKYRPGDAQIAEMHALLERDGMTDRHAMNLSFALAKAHDDIGDFDQAFALLANGNRLRKAELGYDISYAEAQFVRIKSAFSADLPPLEVPIEVAAPQRRLPIFVLGMPRSGTTLVEQILASHSEVHGAGELDLLNQAIAASDWQAKGLASATLQSIRDVYVSGLAKIVTSEPYLTDKMPLNFLWIGFILTAVPEAKIVHVKRDARATCWSNFKHYFSNKGNGFANDLRDIAKYYRLYADLMDFWEEKFPQRIYALSYEALTESQEDETRKLLEHVGLNWEAGCLEFHRTERTVPTASATQVRQRMYQGSSEAWRNYATHLEPMLELLKGF